MSWKHVHVDRDGPIWTVRLSNPPTHTLTARGVLDLLELVGQAEAEEGLRVLVLTGEGEGVFVAHYEVGELAAASAAAVDGADGGQSGSVASDEASGQGPAPQLHPFHQLLLRLERLPAITIAALNGNAAGGGCELSLACDFRLMAEGSFHYGLPETSVAIIPGAGGTQRMARLLGTARALDLILHARLLTPLEAQELGLVHRVFPAEIFAAEVQSFAQDLARRAPLALAAAKEAILRGVELPLEQGLALEQACFERTMRSKDAAEAMKAFLRGESYEWKGR